MIEKEIADVRSAFKPVGTAEPRIIQEKPGGPLGVLRPQGIPTRAWMVTILSMGGWLLVNADGSLFNLIYSLIEKDLRAFPTIRSRCPVRCLMRRA